MRGLDGSPEYVKARCEDSLRRLGLDYVAAFFGCLQLETEEPPGIALAQAASDLVLARATQVKFAGAIAVDVFFVVSGFLIAASLQRNSVRGYLGSRALRILPALVACVLLSVSPIRSSERSTQIMLKTREIERGSSIM